MLTFLALLLVQSVIIQNAHSKDVFNVKERHQKSGEWEINPYGGSYLGRSLGQTWTAGSRLHYHLNSTWAFGANYGYLRNSPDPSSNFGKSVTNLNSHIVNAEALISNDAALRVGDSLLEMDFYLTLGAGAMSINSTWEPAGLIGGGVKFYTGKPWLAFVIDVNNYVHYTPIPAGNKFDFDVIFTGGVSFLIP